MSEKLPSSEFTQQEEELIRKLREQGAEHPETRKLLEDWIIEQEAVANQKNTPRASIELNLKRAQLYRAAGYIDEARENLEAVRRQATQEEENDLLQVAESLMDQIEAEIDVAIEGLLKKLDSYYVELYNRLSPELQEQWYWIGMGARIDKDGQAAKAYLEEFIKVLEAKVRDE
ncbi:MAG: hypothetical protein AAB897_02570 [Patescibacteria group bacterium]